MKTYKKQDEEISYATSKKNILKCKLVFVGDQGVGKSSIINRFIKDQFDPTHNPTVGIDFVSKNVNVSGVIVRLQLWDTAGQQRFRSLIPGYLRDCQAAFVVFDLTQVQTYGSIHRWIDFVKQSRGDDASIYIIGNKSDLSSQNNVIQLSKLRQQIQQAGCRYFEVSAKTGSNIEKVFKEVSSDLLNLNDHDQSTSLQLQKKKLIQVGISVQAERKQTVKKEKKPVPQNKVVNLKATSQRQIKQKNCC